MKTSNALNKYIQDFFTLRTIIRLISYGCYSRSDFENFNISGRSYDDAIRRLKFCLAEDKLSPNRHHRALHLSFSINSYQKPFNFLINTFKIKTMKPQIMTSYLLLLQIFSAIKIPLSISEVFDTIFNSCPDFADSLDEQFLRRRLKEMVALGYLTEIKEQQQYLYQLTVNPLDVLDKNQLTELFYAINFAANTALMSTPAYYLMETISQHLEQKYNFKLTPFSIHQFKNNVLTRMLDDLIIIEIIKALKTNKHLLITEFNKQDYPAKPLKIITEYTYNRQYLLAQVGKVLKKIRLDKIIGLSLISPNDSFESKPPKKKLQTLTLKLTADSNSQQFLESRAKNELPIISWENCTSTSFIVKLQHQDLLSLVPTLRTFFPYLTIIEDSTKSIKKRLQQDLMEALKNYETIS